MWVARPCTAVGVWHVNIGAPEAWGKQDGLTFRIAASEPLRHEHHIGQALPCRFSNIVRE